MRFLLHIRDTPISLTMKSFQCRQTLLALFCL
nr:MAG TPA: hypothetical protein [Bacteriophage sp.]